jgi:hypothetical protein
MSNVVLRSLLVSPAILGLALASSATAQEADTLAQINEYANEGAGLSQVRSVNQLSDVKPTDWAYQALRSLVERYGCVAGYPDGTFRGNRAMTRYEAAALINACLDTVNELIASATADLATQEDLLVLQRLQEEFQAELATLRGRVDALEARTAELEANQFSTTTKLTGEVIFSLQDEFGTPDTASASDINTTFGGRVRLNLDSSFTGSDQLRIRLQANNIVGAASTYNSGALEYGGPTTASSFILNDLWYSFKPSEKSSLIVGTHGLGFDNFVPTMAWDGGSFFSNVFDDPSLYDLNAGSGAGGGGAGIGGNYQFNDNLNLAAGFLSNGAAAATPAAGVFIDNWAGMAQLTGTTGKFEGALAVAYEYGEIAGVAPFGGGGGTLTLGNALTGPNTNLSVGVSTKYEFSPRFILSAFGAVGLTDLKGSTTGDATSYTAGLGFILPDLFREGNTGGIAIGIPPTVSDSSASIGVKDSDTPFIIDLFYDFKVSDNISIIPGGIVLFNGAGGNFAAPDSDDTVFVGAIKTKFTF